MPLSLRPRAVPQCPACLRNYALGGFTEVQRSPFRQQVRGKKKMPNNSGTITVRLLKDVKAYGRKGAIVPIPTGAMRNTWYPSRIAEYVTMPELKRLRLNNVAMERDFEFGMSREEKARSADANAQWQKDIPGDIKGMSNAELRSASSFERAKMEPNKVTPERSMELVDLFVPPRLEFYRQPIIEEKEVEKPVAEPIRIGGAAGDLLAARSRGPEKAKEKMQAIYGSVSAQDVMVAVRAVMSNNDEAARVVLHESEIQLVGLPGEEGSEAGRVKHIGDFVVEIKVRGSETAIQRTVRVLPQET